MAVDYDILGVGNAIMDIIAPLSDVALKDLNITRGVMTLIDQDRALDLSRAFARTGEKPQEIAGGSAANTLVGIAALGLRGAYIGKVADDDLGARFGSGMREAGVHYNTAPLIGGEATARCLIAVTPDGERSMSTFLGASVMFDAQDVVQNLIERARILYLEGYLYDQDMAKQAFERAAGIARKAGREVALTLSDKFCVDRHRKDFQALVDNHVDIVFANEAELLSLYETEGFDSALKTLENHCNIACITRSEKGSVILENGQRHIIPRVPVDKIVDTTGAGDQYAAGVLSGYAMGLSWPDAGYLGSLCAAEVISHYGARPENAVVI